MLKSMPTLITCLALACLSVYCNGAGAEAPRILKSERPSGLEVISTCYYENFNGKGKTASLDYVTRVNFQDPQARSNEVDAVWAGFQPEVERLGAKRAWINPHSSKTGGISTLVLFETSPDGRWSRRPQAPLSPAGTTEVDTSKEDEGTTTSSPIPQQTDTHISFSGTGAQVPSIPEYREQGKFKVISTCYFEDLRGKGKAVSLRYVTRVDYRDREALSNEVDEVWSVFRSEAKRLHAKQALINASPSESGDIATTYIFEASGGGRWRKRREIAREDPCWDRYAADRASCESLANEDEIANCYRAAIQRHADCVKTVN